MATLTAASLVAVPAVRGAAASTFEFTYVSASEVSSVSPDVVVAGGTYYLFTTGVGIGVYTSTDGENWRQVTGARTPTGPVSDPSVVQLADETYRMYYAERSGTGSQPCSGKQLRYATSSDLITWTVQSGTLLADLGCGVPDVVRDGNSFNLYYVRGGVGLDHGTYMATSPDGLAWTPLDGIRTPKDFVDPSVVKVRDGQWLMMVADFPSGPPTPGFFQKLYVGTSTDGRTWDFGEREPVYAPAGVSAFDPNLNLMPDGTLKAWFARGASAEVATVAYGVLTQEEPAPVLVAPAKPTVVLTKSRATISWQFPVGASTPDSFVIERKSGSTWVEVGDVAADKRTFATTVKALGGKAGKTVTVRVVATLGDQRAESAPTTARVPKG